MKTYTVRTGRKDAWWWIEIPEVEMGYSQARKFRDIVPMATEAISLLLDIPQDSFAVEVQVEGDEANWIHLVEESEAAADAAQAAATRKKAEAVRALVARNIPVRDVAEMLHISASYVSQLNSGRLSA